ncbi:MAG: hypothetical protein ABJA50_13945 [Chloroflexota bacterium]
MGDTWDVDGGQTMFSKVVQMPGMHLFGLTPVAFDYEMRRVFAWFKETPCFTGRPARE